MHALAACGTAWQMSFAVLRGSVFCDRKESYMLLLHGAGPFMTITSHPRLQYCFAG